MVLYGMKAWLNKADGRQNIHDGEEGKAVVLESSASLAHNWFDYDQDRQYSTLLCDNCGSRR